jgi:hypothetical protein
LVDETPVGDHRGDAGLLESGEKLEVRAVPHGVERLIVVLVRHGGGEYEEVTAVDKVAVLENIPDELVLEIPFPTVARSMRCRRFGAENWWIPADVPSCRSSSNADT